MSNLRVSEERTELLHTLLERYCFYLNRLSTDEMMRLVDAGNSITLKDAVMESIKGAQSGR